MCKRIDTAVLDWVESATHYIQRQFGWSSFTVAKAVCGAYAAIVAVHMLMTAYRTGSFGMGGSFDFLVVAIWGQKALFGIDRDYERVAESSAERCANPSRYRAIDIVLRLLCLSAHAIGLPFTVTRIFDTDLLGAVRELRGWLFLAYLYLEACSPLPPCKGRFWEALRASQQRMVPVGSGK
jgi:hypothetical protein